MHVCACVCVYPEQIVSVMDVVHASLLVMSRKSQSWSLDSIGRRWYLLSGIEKGRHFMTRVQPPLIATLT